jgi:hypothetical protein
MADHVVTTVGWNIFDFPCLVASFVQGQNFPQENLGVWLHFCSLTVPALNQTPWTLSMLFWCHRYVSKSDKKNATGILREAEERFRDELMSSEVAHLALM